MSNKKKVLIVSGCAAGVLAACYVGVSIYFSQVFYPNTSINGTDVSNESPESVKETLEQSMMAYEMKVLTIEGTTEVLSGKDFDFDYNFDEVDELKIKEMGWLWPVKFFSQTDYEIKAVYEWNEEKLNKKIDELQCMTQEMTAPVNASLNVDEYGVNVGKGNKGTTLIKAAGIEEIAKALGGGRAEIQDELKKVDELCQAEITYDFHGNEEKIGKEQIRKWIRRGENGDFYVSESAAYDYLCEISNKYDTINSYRDFYSSRGYWITLNPGSYGWGTDVDSEIELLMDDIKNKRVTSREPIYYMTPYDYLDPNSPDDIGSTYIEIDLSGQYMWYYKDGALFISTPITSGTMSTGHGTPSGVYYIHNRLQNIVLVGDDYRQPVNFWMKIVGGVGIHDSLWRSTYGGTEYLTSGSHGCINTPYDAVESMFWNVEIGTPVIMYY